MTAKEMHIQFGLGLQKLGAISRRKFYPEEIDALLNKAQDQFVLDQVRVDTDSHGFQRIQVDVDKVRPLIVRDHEVPAEYEKTLAGYQVYRAQLPSDYAHLISDAWYTAKDCSTVTEGDYARAIYTLPFPKSTNATAPYYSTLRITVDSADIVDVQLHTRQGQLGNLYTGLKSKEDHFRALQLLQEVFHERLHNGDLPGSVQGLYFERFQNYHYPGQLILVGTPGLEVTISVDAVYASTGNKDTSFPRKTALSGYRTVTSRLVKASLLDNMLNTVYLQPLKQSPITSIDGTQIRIYTHPSYIVNKGSLTLIRKAARIDLGLQRNSELAPEFHQRIVDMAVEYAAGRIEQPGLYQVTASENQRNQ